ncbi:MAG: GTPase Era [Ignavibacteriales bacterium]|nr:GTPase Era [Ignavibacteriales bacterium]MCF8435943.1 GTPase Era [Ignavibacteriales bacterium]
MDHRCGYVAIIGKPNAGKSTLMNAILGEKLSITTSKPQTTRKRVMGILSDAVSQVIFLDTPGILNPEYLLQNRMLEFIELSILDADLLLLIVDAADDPTAEKFLNDPVVQDLLNKSEAGRILLLNKIDLAPQAKIQEALNNLSAQEKFLEVIPVSALNKFNIERILPSLLENLPIHPKFFPDDQLSDENERFFVSEIIREKVFELFQDEIPYSTEVIIEDFKEQENRKDVITATIIVERESQKPIIIGKSGSAIKKLGEKSRASIEEFLGRGVFLELRVKVKEKWRSDPKMLKYFGYKTE